MHHLASSIYYNEILERDGTNCSIYPVSFFTDSLSTVSSKSFCWLLTGLVERLRLKKLHETGRKRQNPFWTEAKQTKDFPLIIDFFDHVLSFGTQNYLHHLKDLYFLAWNWQSSMGGIAKRSWDHCHIWAPLVWPLTTTPALCVPLVLMANVWPQEFVHCEIVTAPTAYQPEKKIWWSFRIWGYNMYN
jgi:hypothetical protein